MIHMPQLPWHRLCAAFNALPIDVRHSIVTALRRMSDEMHDAQPAEKTLADFYHEPLRFVADSLAHEQEQNTILTNPKPKYADAITIAEQIVKSAGAEHETPNPPNHGDSPNDR